MEENKILSLHPFSKIWIIPLAILPVLLFHDYHVNLLVFFILLFLSVASNRLMSFLKIISKSIFILCITIFIMQLLFFKKGGLVYFTAGILEITSMGLTNALNTATNILTMGSAFLLYFRMTTEDAFINALEQAGFPKKFCFVISSTLQMIPQLKQNSIVIMEAQKARGIEVEGKLSTRIKAFLPSLGPLVLASIAATEERAITLESRGFSVEGKKTKIREQKKEKRDYVIKNSSIFLLIIILISKIVLMVGR